MSPRAEARDHRGIAESTDAGPQRPQTADEPSQAGERDDVAPWLHWSGPDWHVSWRHHDLDYGWHGHNRNRNRNGNRGRTASGSGTGTVTGNANHPHQSRRHLRRDPDARVLAGICAGFSEASGIDVTAVRIGFALLGLLSGVGIVVYAVGWLLLPLQGESSNIASRALHDRRGIRLIIAIIPLLIGAQIVTSALHIGYTGSFLWPVFLAGGGAVLIWRNVSEQERSWINGAVMPIFRTEGSDGQSPRRWTLIGRLGLGVVLALSGVLVLVLGHTTQAALRPVGGALLVIAAFVVIFGPWWIGLVRDLMAERQGRALAEERSQMAAHVHDSVLQTLALIQRSASDPVQVTRLARSQERELRSWLFEGRPPGTFSEDARTLAEGVVGIQEQVETNHGIEVQVVLVGDCPLTDSLRALLDATREATINAAKWSGAPTVSLYAEVEPDQVNLFVRDRGRGFDLDSVPEHRHGVEQSIRGRMQRHGGVAIVRSSPGEGTEVELTMPGTTSP
jgi:signal transduction histidine kinase